MKAIMKWAEGKNALVIMFAPHIALIVQDLYDEFQHIKFRRFAGLKFKAPQLKPWFSLYRSHRQLNGFIKGIWNATAGKQVTDALFAMIETPSEVLQQNIEVYLANLPKEELPRLVDTINTFIKFSLLGFEDILTDAPLKPSAKRKLKRHIDTHPALLNFFIFVAIPCFVLYRTHPTILYRNARRGDIDAIEKLLRLDNLMTYALPIGKRIVAIRDDSSVPLKVKNRIPTKATFPKNIARKNILLSIAGLIYAVSSATAKPLTPLDIYELFAAIDVDANTKFLDVLPEDIDDLRRNLEPDRNLWHQVIKSGHQKVTQLSG